MTMKTAKTVTVFGAGVAGLTAAHELSVRGFKVTVIAPEINETVHGMTLDRGIGGMARSQFVVDREESATEGMRQLEPASVYLLDDTVEIAENGSGRDVVPENFGQRFKDLFKRVGTKPDSIRLRALQIFMPIVTGTDKTTADGRIKWLKDQLPHGFDSTQLDTIIAFPRVPKNSPRRNWIYFGTGFTKLPAEHGFRFFPSFYRHVFDTMKRTPLKVPLPFEQGRGTVYDNLVPVDQLGFARDNGRLSFTLPRSPIATYEEMRSYLLKILTQLGYSMDDLERFALKLFEYMTSCTKRREREYEHITWSEFVDESSFTPVFRNHLEYGPEMMAALRGSKSDARTQGNTAAQLLLNQIRAGLRPDATLGAPTSSAWFDHWYDFLDDQDVIFKQGEVAGFRAAAAPNGSVAVLVTSARDGNYETPATDYYVLALPAIEMAKIAAKLSEVTSGNDLLRIERFVGKGDLNVASPAGPLHHLSGIQFYFDIDVHFWRAHTQYLDSRWGLTSIAQPQFWFRYRTPRDAYRSLLSVDIGSWDREDRHSRRTAWDSDSMEIACATWEQIVEHHEAAFRAAYGANAKIPMPIAFALDKGISPQHTGRQDKYPFLVNLVNEYPTRPGRLSDGVRRPKGQSSYEVIGGKFVMAGTHMKTFTRLTSMESANESARHAVNRILDHANIACDRCQIFDPEDNELPELAWLKELDEQMVEKGLPHFAKIMGWSELPTSLPVHIMNHLVLRGVRL